MIDNDVYSIPGPPGIPICDTSFDTRVCVADAVLEYLQRDHILSKRTRGMNSASAYGCDCLPLCKSLSYDAELSITDSKYSEYLGAFSGLQFNHTENRFSRLVIFFKETQFITYKRYELYGPVDFLANCGGLLGLFMGFSLLSFIELVYFCSLRLLNDFIMKHTYASN